MRRRGKHRPEGRARARRQRDPLPGEQRHRRRRIRDRPDDRGIEKHRACRPRSAQRKYPDSAAIPELRGSNVGIIGFGTIGRLVADRLQVFGAKILVSDPFVPAEAVTAAGCEPVSKEELLRRSDFVTLHGRIGAGDPPIIGEQELRVMKPTAVLINTARAVLVDMDALYEDLVRRI